ncbi:hypothetical protein HY844_00265 [Candidatus Berkelbacteria bacterium]|nr:hypothetical protein [Candidatus Berkelbacteria bacterium]
MTHDDHEKIDQLVKAIDRAYGSKKRLMLRGFVWGLFSGLGATLGVAIVVALLTLFIQAFGGVPFIGSVLQELSDYLPQN